MKRKELLQSPFVAQFRAHARMKLSHITMPALYRSAILHSINEVELLLQEVSKVSKQEAWSIYTRRLLSACRSEMPVSAETERILKEYRQLLNL